MYVIFFYTYEKSIFFCWGQQWHLLKSDPNFSNGLLDWKYLFIIGKNIISLTRGFSGDIELFFGKVTFAPSCIFHINLIWRASSIHFKIRILLTIYIALVISYFAEFPSMGRFRLRKHLLEIATTIKYQSRRISIGGTIVTWKQSFKTLVKWDLQNFKFTRGAAFNQKQTEENMILLSPEVFQ